MQFAATTLGAVPFGSLGYNLFQVTDPQAARPILVEWNGVDSRSVTRIDSILITDTLGQSVSAECTFIDPSPAVPAVGDRIRILFYSQVLFAGLIDHVDKSSEDLTTFLYHCQCSDWSQILMRRKVRRGFTDMPIANILNSLLVNELLGEPLTVGTIDTQALLHLVDAKNARAFDVCRDMAGAAGQTFYVEFDQSIQMRSSSSPSAPLLFVEASILLDSTSVSSDLETYRNVQTVIVTGKPAGSEDPLMTIEQVRNEEQIAERAAIEGGTGIYEEIAEITHPTSNLLSDLTLLGVTFANIQLSVAGLTRTTVKCRAREYGFRAGQIANVNLPTFGVMGSFVIQRVLIREKDGQLLFHDLELTSSSVQQRVYETWLKIISGGSKVTVQIPGALVHNSQVFTTPGASNFVVPAGVTVITITVKGGSGGGGGGNIFGILFFVCNKSAHYGGYGGNSGKAISSVNVLEGQTIVVTVGAKGVGGTGGKTGCAGGTPAGNGTTGTASTAFRDGISLAEGYAGAFGTAASNVYGINGIPGGGSGSQVFVGGGKTGGARGLSYADESIGRTGGNGSDGEVLIEW